MAIGGCGGNDWAGRGRGDGSGGMDELSSDLS